MSKTSVRRRVKRKARNLLDMVPIRNPEYCFVMHSPEPVDTVEHKSVEKVGVRARPPLMLITIAVPRFRGRLGRGFMKAFGIKPNINVNLDPYGSAVFRKIDGKRSVREIGTEIGAEFGSRIDPLYGRLAHFLTTLEKNELLSFLPKEFDKRPEGSR
jgi:hypothetical protein